ncbi:hypothetical protein O6H91_02G143200 [Diphasiastrum complanatum]|uniref:Uncharacterized protein n=1 Tax=Diphasiastrum complanatum TaxID=34168 RepID=A0ACC2EL75_DIPCM|nr:hypothetical protein O6H91_02G143200 [Diphasiastrum complanatum]
MGRSNEIRQLWHQNGRCPSATVPVRRVTAEDIRRAGSVERYGRKFHQPPKPKSQDLSDVFLGHEHAYAYVNDNQQYYGTRASINVWRPNVEGLNGLSLAQIWLLAGSSNDVLNTIEAGWFAPWLMEIVIQDCSYTGR